MKQSSIEWLIDTMHRSAGLDQNQIDTIFEQALEMHKEEQLNTAHDFYYGKYSIKNFDEYYNETFNQPQ
jgi:hypothetical protein